MELQMLLFFCMNNNNLKVLWKFRLFSLSPGFMNTPLSLSEGSILWTYSCAIFSFAYKSIHKIMNNELLSQICLHYYVYTYIHHGHIWHRNKLSRCQLKLLVSCSNDEHQTSLKWDRSFHPVAPECHVSHTLRLKIFTINVLPFCVSCSIGLNVPAEWHAGCNVRCKLPKQFSQNSNSLAYIDS